MGTVHTTARLKVLRMSAESTQPESRVVFTAGRYSDDDVFLADLKSGHRRAQAEFYLRYSDLVGRIVGRVLGSDHEAGDVVQETFIGAIRGVDRYRGDPGGLKSWLVRIAVNSVRQKLRYRRVRSWLRYAPDDAIPEAVSAVANPEIMHKLKRTYAILDQLNADERIVFTLRVVDRMTLEEIADICDISLSTAKRRLADAREHFLKKAARDPLLSDLVEEGTP
jgi:RNA polymerase sigma-70 factor (ECF subfamily)